MWLKVHCVVPPSDNTAAARDTLEVYAGEGNQILQWLAHTACARLAHKRGEALGAYVPQSVLDRDGRVLDPDLVLREAAGDGGELTVECGAGPQAFRARWDSRPKTPPFDWSDEVGGERAVPHDAWLTALDPAAEGLGMLQDPEFLATALGAGLADLARIKEVLLAHAGMLQVLFLLATADASTPVEATHRMSLAQLKALLASARVVGPGGVSADSVDRVFAHVLATPRAMARRAEVPASAPPAMDLADFMVALVHAAYLRFAAESFAAGPETTPLSTKLLSLLHEALGATVLADLQRKLERLHASAFTPGALLLLRKGRSLTEQVLDRCQLKRVKARVLRVDLRHVLKHMQRWGLLGKEFGLPDVAPVVVFAKQQHSDPRRFALHPVPLSLDYGEMERLLLGTALTLAWARKRRGGGFEEFLGEFLDNIYKRSGVLVDPAAGGETMAAAGQQGPASSGLMGAAAVAGGGKPAAGGGAGTGAAAGVGASSISGAGAATARDSSSGAGGTGGGKY